MNLTRRDLLKGVGGVSVALTLGGVLDDKASASHLPIRELRQYYPPQFLEKFEKYKVGRRIPSICNFCAVGCGVIGTVVGGELIEVEGDPYHPINEGALCSKGNAILDLIKNPRRVLSPMMRTNPKKGEEENPGWVKITWDDAFAIIAEKFKEVWPGFFEANVKHPDGYYLIGRDSPFGWAGSAYCTNEENYLFKKFMTLLGSMNIEHSARQCHASTVVALANTFGFGAMTNHWTDWINAKVLFIMGANPAEQHPNSIRWLLRAKDRGAVVINLDPRYTRTSALADIFVNFRPGTDAAIYMGLIRYVLHEKPERVAWEFLERRTNAPYSLKTWEVLPDWKENPGSVFGRLKELSAPYTPEEVSAITGIPREKFLEIAETFTRIKPGTIIYSMGTTQHTNATHMIRAMAILQLLLGNVGVPGGGVNAERGISNVQGSTDMNVLSHILMGYRTTPRSVADVRRYQKWKNSEPEKRGGVAGGTTYKPANAAEDQWDKRHFPTWNAIEYHWGMFIGTWPGKDPDNEPVVSDLPIGTGYPTVQLYRAVLDGKIRMLFMTAANPAGSVGNASLVRQALRKSEFFVCNDIFESESAHFADILLPGTVPTGERSGSYTNSGRWIQWLHKFTEPAGEAMDEFSYITQLFRRLREAGLLLPSEKFEKDKEVKITRKIGTTEVENNPDLVWPSSFGETVEDVHKELGAKMGVVKVGGVALPQAPTNILYRGSYDPDLRPDLGGILPKRRDRRPASAWDVQFFAFKNWAYSWMDNQRILYSKEEDPKGLNFFFTWWATTPDKWLGFDKAAIFSAPLYNPKKVEDDITKGIFEGKKEQHPLWWGMPIHNEPVESPLKELQDKYPTIWDERFSITKGTSDEFPVVFSTFRLTEHMHVGQLTRNIPYLAELQPESFAELDPELSAQLGIKDGDFITVTSARGKVRVRARVTGRLKPLSINGQKIHVVSMPFHWGFKGLVTGPITNDVTIDAVDIHANIPETKACLCRVEVG